jgi:hypothetical protein
MAPPIGRPPNWVLQRRLAQAILGKEGTPEYKEYCEAMRRQVLAGVLNPAIHTLILHYGYGKPVEEIELEVSQRPDPLVHLTEDELRDRARRISMARYILSKPDELPPGDVDGEVLESGRATVEAQMEKASSE